ncbi:MAG: D-2-hydroxyacid dehydrogenase [Eubacteriales bacterium]|nr:D-2-hydroxyacid dehydrogenase [Eubacteriales bacterium]MDD3289351.1 D-2-hydroxyacid dehydrogenase [Eubacteriales bacterium]MDD4444932.1 D-2-hydroxyacid dehydrogenase [Eubacteriales bacterium]
MLHILVVLSMDKKQKALLESKAPGAVFLYRDQKTVPEEDVKNADIILGNVPEAYLNNASKLRWLQLDSAGSDKYAALPLFREEHARLTNASGCYGLLISEYMVGAALLLCVGFHKYRDQQTAHVWKDGDQAKTVSGSRTLVVGLGDIGSHFAQSMHALGSAVTAIRRTGGSKPPFVESVHTLEDLPTLLQEADIVGVCLPQSPETMNVFDAQAFAAMKPGAFLINVGRGSAVDADALTEALRSGHLGGAVLDVFQPEPLPADHPLWDQPGALITPHIAGLDEQPDAHGKIIALCTRNLEHFMNGEALESQVDLETGYRKK